MSVFSSPHSSGPRREPETDFIPLEPEPARPETPGGVHIDLPEPLRKLLNHPVLLAGGVLAAGALGSRVLMTAGGRRVAGQLAREALKRAAPLAGTAAAGSLLDQGMQKIRPHAARYAKKMLAEMLRKKE